MVSTATGNCIQATPSLQEFFRERIQSSIERHQIDGNEDTLWYLTQLLCNYSRTHRFLDDNGQGATLTPLAEYYRMAVESASKHERRQILQKLGDVAMVVSGLFSGALRRKPVGVRYYMSMGEAAYSALADDAACTSRDRALQSVFETLANDFGDYVVALSEIPASQNNEKNLINLFNEWEDTKHPALERQLRAHGVVLLDESASTNDSLH